MLPAGSWAALALATPSCFSSKPRLPQGGFGSLGLPSPRTHAAAGRGGEPGQRFGRAFQEEVDFHSFEAQLRTCITLPAPFWGRHMLQPGSATPASLGAGGRLGQAGLWSPRLQLGLSLLPAGTRAPMCFHVSPFSAEQLCVGSRTSTRVPSSPGGGGGSFPTQGPPARGAAAPHLCEGPKKTLMSEPGSIQWWWWGGAITASPGRSRLKVLQHWFCPGCSFIP